jgi:hypothetical protein
MDDVGLLLQFPEKAGRIVHMPGALPEAVDVRTIPLSEKEAAALADLGNRLSAIGATATGLLCIGIAARFKVAA